MEMEREHTTSLPRLRYVFLVKVKFCNAMLIRKLARVSFISVLYSNTYFLKVLLMEVLIKNAQALFHEFPFPPTPPSCTQAKETASITSYGSLFLSPEFPQHSEVQAMGSFLRPRPVSHIYASTQSTSSVSPSESTVDLSGRITPPS